MNRNLSVYLDLVRLGAALGVFLSHAKRFIDPGLSKLLSTHGPECVALFFVLSGFVIRYATLRGETGVKSYAVARMSRMWSVAIPAILVGAICDRIGVTINPNFYKDLEFWDGPATILEIARSLAFLNETWGARVTMGTNEAYWSLGYEVAYYIAFCIIFIKSTIGRLAFLFIWCAVFGPQIIAYGLLWALGIFAFDFAKKYDGSAHKNHKKLAMALFLSPALYPILKYLVFPPAGSPMRFDSIHQWLVSYAYFLSIGILISAHFIGCSMLFPKQLAIPKTLEKAITWAAGTTFTIYLMHQPIIVMMSAINNIAPSKMLSGYLGLAVAIVILFLLAELGERRKQQARTILNWAAAGFTLAKRGTNKQ